MSNHQKGSYQQYLEQKHAKFNTSVSIIDKVVTMATGSKFTNLTKVIQGEINEVYDIVLANLSHVIVRISRSSHPRFLVGNGLLQNLERQMFLHLKCYWLPLDRIMVKP